MSQEVQAQQVIDSMKIRIFDLSEAIQARDAEIKQLVECLQGVVKALGIEGEEVSYSSIVAEVQKLKDAEIIDVE
nr:MAG TPA: tail fiber assembly helper protein [Caudoviricetes sp.]